MTDPAMQSASGRLALVLPARGLTGPVPWMIAVMTVLAMLGTAAAIGLTPAARALSGQIAGRVTVQIIDGDPIVRRNSVAAVRTMLRDLPYVSAVRSVPEEELQALASQWLGEGANASGLALPALIDVDLVGSHSGGDVARLRNDIRSLVPSARVTAHADWLGPVAGLMRTIGWLSAAIALLLVATAAATAVISARASLVAQRGTIDVLHLVGATDVQIARLFQRQTAHDTMIGAASGAAVGIVLILLLGWLMQGVTSGLVADRGWTPYMGVMLVPPLIITAAVLSARLAVLRSLRAMP